mgnify:CR=1 FL=1
MSRFFLTSFFLFCALLGFAQQQIDDKEKRHRIFIEDFLQEYQSAYEKERIEYISLFFSTDALISTKSTFLYSAKPIAITCIILESAKIIRTFLVIKILFNK